VIDVHLHARAGWDREEVARELAALPFERGLLLAAPIDHWGSDLNEGCARLVAEFPDRLIGMVGVHPPDLDGSLRAIEEYGRRGFVGVKLMPTSGYYPDDERHRKVFEEIDGRGWMVLSHCGWCSRGVKERDLPQSTGYADPYHIEPLARTFTATDFILAHGGGMATFPRAWELNHYMENVYIDSCPGHGPWTLEHGTPWLDAINWDRVLFGTDLLLGDPESAAGYAARIERIRGVIEKIGFGDRLDSVLHGNAARLLEKRGR
jgi:predicted TIM-barrel fold metal-dependent hydrolase